MNGRIIIYCKDVSAGVIEDAAGRKYLFNYQSWMSGPALPSRNTEVLFSPSSLWATDIWAALVPDIRADALAVPLALRA